MKKYLPFFTVFLSILIIGCDKKQNSNLSDEQNIDISVNPTVELFSLIHHLAGDKQYNENLIPDYLKKVDRHFEHLKNHSAINFAKECNSLFQINGDAPMALAVYIGQPPQLEPKINLSALPKDFDPRWDSTLISNYLKHAREFAVESEFMKFHIKQNEFHKESVENLKEMFFKENIIERFFTFFGYYPDNFRINIALLNGSCNYGYKTELPDGKIESVCLLGARDPKWFQSTPTYSKKWFLPVIIHEFCHSYINPLIISKPEEFKAIGDTILKSHYDAMRKKGYDVWNVVLNEYLVRACTIKFLKEHEGIDEAERNIKNDKLNGFVEIEGLVQLLEEYENHRNEYPEIESFLPEIKKYFKSKIFNNEE
ncbi:MAG: DUF4932 domain-containing protein [Ignavibacteriales bacterium]|nr:DUF4932 domain-containing protein [Ignavibacteriales bacterium]MCF8437437.1 DUF4932 domain-containing protein [Ignavibacteriales bacterium]